MNLAPKVRSDTRKVVAGRCAGADGPRFGPTSGCDMCRRPGRLEAAPTVAQPRIGAHHPRARLL